MQVGGILETALYVSDIKRAAEFYRRLFGFPTLLESERLIALDVAGGASCCCSPRAARASRSPCREEAA